jgi:Zn-dependent protease
MSRLRDPQALIAVGLILVALYGLRRSVSSTTLLVLLAVIPSIILHEISHGVVALWCGDDTAKRAGRLTLNPIPHIDPLGTLILPALLALSGLGAFGYAKPVPVNPARMRHPRNDAVLVSLAGPATNLIIAGLSIVALRDLEPAGTAQAVYTTILFFGSPGLSSLGLFVQFLYLLGLLNVVLAVFNALPIPPLDGSILVERLLPASALPMWWQVRRYAMIVLFVLVLLDPHQFLARIFDPVERAWAHLLIA